MTFSNIYNLAFVCYFGRRLTTRRLLFSVGDLPSEEKRGETHDVCGIGHMQQPGTEGGGDATSSAGSVLQGVYLVHATGATVVVDAIVVVTDATAVVTSAS